MAEEKGIKEKMDDLAAPLPAEDISWRVTRTNKPETKAYVVPYMSARAVMNRLDLVLGPENWGDEHVRWGEKGVKCRLAIRFEDAWIFKEDGAAETSKEATKGGFSDAFKRAGVKWGIGRYLYRVPEFVVHLSAHGKNLHKCKNGGYRYWNAPDLPAWALPGGTGGPPAGPRAGGTGAGQNAGPKAGDGRAGSPGKASGGHTGEKPKCPKCGKAATVIKSKFKAGEWVCWENSPNDDGGCGHKWGQAPTKEGPAGEAEGVDPAIEKRIWNAQNKRLRAMCPEDLTAEEWDINLHHRAFGMYPEAVDAGGEISLKGLSGREMKAIADVIHEERKA